MLTHLQGGAARMVIAIELLGALLLVAAAGLMWLAKPQGLQPAAFLARSYTVEVSYALLVLVLTAGGLGSILWGIL